MATADYRDEMDILGQFLNECVCHQPGSKIPANDLFATYSGWCRSNGERPESQRKFSNKVTELGNVRLKGAQNRYSWEDMGFTPIGRDYLALGGAGMGSDPDASIDLFTGTRYGDLKTSVD